MPEKLRNVLFLCTGNSARSILAEAVLNHWGKGRFRASSAGSFPTGRVNPLALQVLSERGIDPGQPRSKSWDEFSGPDAPQMDFIITVCDAAAGESCPVWLGHPLTAHWGVPDPAAVEGSDATKHAAFLDALLALEARIKLMINLPMAKLEKLALQQHLNDIGRSEGR
jgi:arsenate reductase